MKPGPHKRTMREVRDAVLKEAWRPGEDSCWETNYKMHKRGYPQLSYNGRVYKVHRFVYLSLHPRLKKHVLHKCDNPKCVRPSHLYAGTDLDNARDRMVRGRHGAYNNNPYRDSSGRYTSYELRAM